MKEVTEKKIIFKKEDSIFIDDVLSYYYKYGRHDLPWRHTITPYMILVSEVMLQQTQVSRVLPKFLLWMKLYPDLATFAAAPLRDILLLWQGLGYQRRAKALTLIAKETSVLPEKYDDLLRLPGIGVYTASALCAFAYNRFDHPVLETNIRTALIEYFHQDGTSIHDGVLYDDLFRITQHAKVKNLGAREWYYALMDFGAYLKTQKISHNTKSKHYVKQTPYKGSMRELRAKVLFAITHKEKLPVDARTEEVIEQLLNESFIVRKGKGYSIS